jgi:hypothetical protein
LFKDKIVTLDVNCFGIGDLPDLLEGYDWDANVVLEKGRD